jgi:septum formation protein
MKFILASASPRRRELIEYVRPGFKCVPADIDESLPPDIAAEESAEYLACMKAMYVASQFPESVVIGCDTVVVYGNRIFGKPASEEEAYEMLSSLSGKTHKVITGVCICGMGRKESFSETTSVEFYDLTEREIKDYIAGGSPMDKAGAYGIQDAGCLPAKSITGDYFNVVGLHAARLRRVLEQFLGEND